MRSIRNIWLLVGIGLAISAPAVHGQGSPSLDIQAHAGKGDGYVSSISYGFDVAVNLVDWIALQGGFARWHPFNVGCAQVWPGSYACTFEGNTLTGVARIRMIKGGRIGLFGVAGLGAFRHTDNIIHGSKLAVPFNIELHVDLSPAWRAIASWKHLWIADSESEALLEERPKYSMLAIGIQRRIMF